MGLSPSGAYAAGNVLQAVGIPPMPVEDAFLWHNGTMTQIPGSGWDSAASVGSGYNSPYAVNDNGTVVGKYNGSAFYYNPGNSAPTAIPGLPSGSAAYGITNQGLVVGDWDGTSTNSFTYNIATNTLTEITGAAAWGVSQDGTKMAGLDSNPTGCYIHNGTVTELSDFVVCQGIDSSGKYIVGWGTDWTSSFSLLYNTTTSVTTTIRSTDINTSADWPGNVNSTGVVVGPAAGSSGNQAYLYDGTLHDISSLTLSGAPVGISWDSCAGITDSGKILVYGHVGDNYRSYLLSPVPEPLTLLLAATGLLGLMAYAWRKRK